jgi:CheY-like chemotaxis protein
MLAGLMGQSSDVSVNATDQRPRKVLVCVPEENRDRVARLLAQEGHQVFVAMDTKQAVERMRENQLDIVVLDPQFDAPEQGAAFVVREVNVLRPPQRRRLFFVLLSPSLRTMDSHGAFLNNVNAIINLKDLDDLVRVINHSLRSFNELYKDFNAALHVAGI